MRVTLAELQRIATDAAKCEDRRLEVVGVIPAEGGSTYSEVVITIDDCRTEPCRMMIGVNREASVSEIRETVVHRLRQHLDEHRLA